VDTGKHFFFRHLKPIQKGDLLVKALDQFQKLQLLPQKPLLGMQVRLEVQVWVCRRGQLGALHVSQVAFRLLGVHSCHVYRACFSRAGEGAAVRLGSLDNVDHRLLRFHNWDHSLRLGGGVLSALLKNPVRQGWGGLLLRNLAFDHVVDDGLRVDEQAEVLFSLLVEDGLSAADNHLSGLLLLTFIALFKYLAGVVVLQLHSLLNNKRFKFDRTLNYSWLLPSVSR
jgi:hypothetical protein